MLLLAIDLEKKKKKKHCTCNLTQSIAKKSSEKRTGTKLSNILKGLFGALNLQNL